MTKLERAVLEAHSDELRLLRGTVEAALGSLRSLHEKVDRLEATANGNTRFALETTRRLIDRHDQDMRVVGEIVTAQRRQEWQR